MFSGVDTDEVAPLVVPLHERGDRYRQAAAAGQVLAGLGGHPQPQPREYDWIEEYVNDELIDRRPCGARERGDYRELIRLTLNNNANSRLGY